MEEYFAIKLNSRYWLGGNAVAVSGVLTALAPAPSEYVAVLLPTDSPEDTIARFKNLCEAHGGTMVKLSVDSSSIADYIIEQSKKVNRSPLITTDDVERVEKCVREYEAQNNNFGEGGEFFDEDREIDGEEDNGREHLL